MVIWEQSDQGSLSAFPYVQKKYKVHLDIHVIYVLYAADLKADIIFRTT